MVSAGPITAVVNPAFENRLRDDPDFRGEITQTIAGRMQSAYVAVAGSAFALSVGRLARNWGPADDDGLLVSPAAYSRDALLGSIRFGRLTLTSFAERLEDWDSTLTGQSSPFSRYAFGHRLSIELGRGAWLSLHEAGVYGGPGRGFELVIHSPLNLALLSEFNDGVDANIFLGADVAVPFGGGWRAEAEGFLDDIQVDNDPARISDRRPTSYGATVLVRWAAPSRPLQVALVYTRVTSLAYRNQFNASQEYSLQRVGLGRNYSDYDQGLVRVEYRPSRDAGLQAEAGFLRQGSGDFRQPFPTDSVLALPGQGFLVAPVRSAFITRISGTVRVAGAMDLRAEIGRDGAGGMIAGASAGLTFDVVRRRLGAEAGALDRAGVHY
jgi:hypothetical protein